MKKLLFVIALAACGGGSKQTPPPADPVPTGGPSAMSPDECTTQGGRVKGDIGDGKVACDPGERDLGRVNQGIEGAVCCAAAEGTPTQTPPQ